MPETEIEVIENEKLDKIVIPHGDNIVPYLFSLEKVKKTSCKLCNAEFREEAETFYDRQRTKNYVAIQRWLEEEKEFKISHMAIRNHMLYHHRAAERNIALAEYSEDLQKWVDSHVNKAAAIRARIAVLTKEMLTLSSLSEDLDGDEKRKTVELIRKIAETITFHEEKLITFEEQGKPVTLIFNQLKIIFSEEMKHNNSPAVKKAFITALTRLQERMGDILVE